MAKDMQVKKRKASVPEVDAEKAKTKKIKNTSASNDVVETPAKKRKATEDVAPVKIKKSKTPKPAAQEPLEPESTKNGEDEAPAVKKSKGTKLKKAPTKDVATESKSKTKPTPKSSKVTKDEVSKLNAAIEPESEDDEEDSDIDDQTEALLKGFESDGDEEDALNEEGLPEGEPVPERKQLSKAEEKQLKKIAESGSSDKPGVIYIGRIPHGFFEHEMRAYFKQFGNILNLRLSRNKKTGNSKHFGWIQFESATVADIVARTMDNYLMFGHLLKAKVIPDEQVHEDLFKGANKRFKKVPWNKLEGRKIAQGASEEAWDARVDREEKRRDEKAKKLQAIGYEFEAPKVKSAKGVSKNKPVAIEPAGDETNGLLAIEAAPAPVAEEPTKSKRKSKKGAKSEFEPKEMIDEEKVEGKVEGVAENVKTKKKAVHKDSAVPPTVESVKKNLAALEAEELRNAEKVQKPKKQEKAKTADVSVSMEEEPTPSVAEEPSGPKAKKGKKDKKLKAVETKATEVNDVAEVPKVRKGKKSKGEIVAA